MSGVRVPIEIRLWPKVNKDGLVSVLRPELGKCWIWTASKQGNGYGKFSSGGRDGKWLAAHRVVYEILVAKIEQGLELDHLCKVILCVNPDHLEPVTPRENKLRSTSPAAIHARKTHCPKDHPYDEQTTRWNRNMRHCRLCAMYYQRALRTKRRLEKCA